ncbi:uncharacterized protein K460DRAFT_359623 [Cucurbitaria berberidis CBS 394.84]|uniref:Uncharacterized protein n=1 Tax=Cucurbitaria berberidis CBS 394.84 TaxID=1168544 RepID=A0A9P4G9C4_9PLEO|nr:uncharacterized protein K460DRAFT_359623 [Cucurbitaria berberidis CBS 394.84]KAF1841089.1 hypothetical protein K460DRAFT_359623 [Cucurbitaria berberidis CBS 394.84]
MTGSSQFSCGSIVMPALAILSPGRTGVGVTLGCILASPSKAGGATSRLTRVGMKVRFSVLCGSILKIDSGNNTEGAWLPERNMARSQDLRSIQNPVFESQPYQMV